MARTFPTKSWLDQNFSIPRYDENILKIIKQIEDIKNIDFA